MKRNENEKNKRLSILLILLLLLLMITIGITIWALFFREDKIVLAPDYAPQETEKNAEDIPGDGGGDKLPQEQGGGAVSLIYSKEATIDLSENTAKLLFGNPQKSNQNMLVQIVIQDTVILQSGLITPGHQVTKLELFDNIKLSPGIYEGKLAVYYYQPDTGEKAMLNTDIVLNITVQE